MSSRDNEDKSIEHAVRTNLVHFQNWSDVKICNEELQWRERTIRLLSGIPQTPLANGDSDSDGNPVTEFLLPVNLAQYKSDFITIECLDLIFERLCKSDTKRIILSIVNDDGTIVFYFVYKGVHKPKK